MEKILITAIGSFSADCAISTLRSNGWHVVGCDIYPKEWHYEASLCNQFYQAPYATDEDEYIGFLLNVIAKERITHLMPLTDLEIDVINRHRDAFKNVRLCIQSSEALSIARDKYALYERFTTNPTINAPSTELATKFQYQFKLPAIAKPRDGRSSEGLRRINKSGDLEDILRNENYIIQEAITGNIFCVDVCRDKYGNCVAVPREELIRTKNGAGMTVRINPIEYLLTSAYTIATVLDIVGCVNFEFIHSDDGKFYLIDINPRFSAGVAFSKLAGYDMVTNSLRAFNGDAIEKQPSICEQILQKRMVEVCNSKEITV